MRTVPVPDSVRNADWCQSTFVAMSPDGNLLSDTIPPAEAFRYIVQLPTGETWPAVGVVILLEEEDIEAINNGARHFIMGWPGGGVPVYMVPEMIVEEEGTER